MKKISIGIISACVITAGLLSCSTSSKKPTEREIPGHEKDIRFLGQSKVDRFVLPNGLTLLVVADSSSPTFSYQTWFRVGSRNEKPGYTGLAHLFEHLMFKGTKNHPDGELDSLLESAGVEGENAFTTTDYTAYVQELPKRQLELIIKLESDRMVNLIVDDAIFKKEREVVQNERRMRFENNPEGLLFQELMSIAFKQHPYHWPVIGYESDLNQMTAGDAKSFYQKFYHPNRATVVVVGDVDPYEVYDLVLKYYGDIPSRAPLQETPLAEPEQIEPWRSTMKLDMPEQRMILGYPVPSCRHVDSPALDVIEALLSKGRGSRLERALVDTGIATHAWCDNQGLIDPSLFVCGATLQNGKAAAIAEKVFLDEFKKLTNQKISAQELQKAKNLALFQIYQGLTDNNAKANWLGTLETQYGRFETGLSMLDDFMKVTPEDVQRVAQQYFRPERRNVVIGVPK